MSDFNKNMFLAKYGTKDHLDKLVDDKDPDVVTAVMSNDKSTKTHIDKALDSDNWLIRYSPLNKTKLSKEHLFKLLSDKEPYIRETALDHPSIQPEHLQYTAGEDSNWRLRNKAEGMLKKLSEK